MQFENVEEKMKRKPFGWAGRLTSKLRIISSFKLACNNVKVRIP